DLSPIRFPEHPARSCALIEQGSPRAEVGRTGSSFAGRPCYIPNDLRDFLAPFRRICTRYWYLYSWISGVFRGFSNLRNICGKVHELPLTFCIRRRAVASIRRL